MVDRSPDASIPLDHGLSVLVIDGHRMLGELMSCTLRGLPRVTAVATAGCIAGATTQLARASFDVVLVDVHLPDGSGLDLVPSTSATPGTRVIVLTGHPRRTEAACAVDLGASGYLAKDGSLATLIRALHHASPVDVHLAERFPEDRLADGALTGREREVLLHLVDGRSAARIAAEMTLSVLTVRTHIKSALAKLGVQSQIEAVAVASQTGLRARAGR